jgi:formylglycine-generating enzyme required for sulfatase activity
MSLVNPKVEEQFIINPNKNLLSAFIFSFTLLIYNEMILSLISDVLCKIRIFIFIFLVIIIIEPSAIYSQNINYDSMVFIPPNEFIMGLDDKNCNCPEYPAHKVNLNGFYIDVFEVTNAQYEKFIEANGYNDSTLWTPEGWLFRLKNNINLPKFWYDDNYGLKNPNRPVVGISWYEAYAYAKWKGKRLPTEAEWERSARGNQQSILKPIYPWGTDEPDLNRCNYGYIYGNTLYGGTKDVGSFETGKSPDGIYDMAGNVSEWCFDWYKFDYYSETSSDNPQGPEYGEYKSVRGGSWLYYKRFIRTTTRDFAEPNTRSNIIGLRCARTP